MTSSCNAFNGTLNRTDAECGSTREWMRREIGRRTTDSNVFYDKSLHPEYVLDVCLRCIVDTLRGEPCTGIYEYRDETFKHDAFLVVLLSFRSHSKASFFPLSPSILLCFCFCRARREREKIISPHGMRMCCSLSIDSFCDFYSHFLCVQKANHLPMCYVCSCTVSA